MKFLTWQKDSMIYRTPQHKLDEYFSSDRLNQSAIKVLLEKGIDDFLEMQARLISAEDSYYEDAEHFIIGKGVDCRITEGIEVFREKYCTITAKPSATVMAILRRVLGYAGNEASIPLAQLWRQICQACDEEEYYMRNRNADWENDPRPGYILKNVDAVCYWGELVDNMGSNKQILTEKQNTLITLLSNNILEHEFTGYLFRDSEDVDILFQLPLYFEVSGVLCKALPDTIRIAHNTQTIYLLDIKSTKRPVLQFNEDVRIRRYDIQGSLYTKGIMECLVYISNLVGKDVTKYRIADFAFVVESTTRPGTPFVFPLKPDALYIGEKGDNLRRKGWYQGIQIYKEWEKYHFSKEEMFRECRGVIPIEYDYNYSNLWI